MKTAASVENVDGKPEVGESYLIDGLKTPLAQASFKSNPKGNKGGGKLFFLAQACSVLFS